MHYDSHPMNPATKERLLHIRKTVFDKVNHVEARSRNLLGFSHEGTQMLNAQYHTDSNAENTYLTCSKTLQPTEKRHHPLTATAGCNSKSNDSNSSQHLSQLSRRRPIYRSIWRGSITHICLYDSSNPKGP